MMKQINYSAEKNLQLIIERGVSFEDVILEIEGGRIIDVLEHPNKLKYPNQYMLVIRLNNYIYLVPFIETKQEMFLKTIYPSRKANTIYNHEKI